eukprot:2358926-Amphidinium_carterae.1
MQNVSVSGHPGHERAQPVSMSAYPTHGTGKREEVRTNLASSVAVNAINSHGVVCGHGSLAASSTDDTPASQGRDGNVILMPPSGRSLGRMAASVIGQHEACVAGPHTSGMEGATLGASAGLA